MFKENLRILREQKHLTRQQMADVLGLSYMNYSHYENRGSEPPYAILVKISQVLGVSIDLLLSDELPANAEKDDTKMETLPAIDSMCFTPKYAMQFFGESEWLKVWQASEINPHVIQTAHRIALAHAKEVYQNEFIVSIEEDVITRELMQIIDKHKGTMSIKSDNPNIDFKPAIETLVKKIISDKNLSVDIPPTENKLSDDLEEKG